MQGEQGSSLTPSPGGRRLYEVGRQVEAQVEQGRELEVNLVLLLTVNLGSYQGMFSRLIVKATDIVIAEGENQ